MGGLDEWGAILGLRIFIALFIVLFPTNGLSPGVTEIIRGRDRTPIPSSSAFKEVRDFGPGVAGVALRSKSVAGLQGATEQAGVA